MLCLHWSSSYAQYAQYSQFRLKQVTYLATYWWHMLYHFLYTLPANMSFLVGKLMTNWDVFTHGA